MRPAKEHLSAPVRAAEMGIAGKKRGRDTSMTNVKPAAAAAAKRNAMNASSGKHQGKPGEGSYGAGRDAGKTHQQAARADRGPQTKSVPTSGAFSTAEHGKRMAALTQAENGCLPAAAQRPRRSKNKFKPEPKHEPELALVSAQANIASHTGAGAAAQYAVASNESSQAPAAPHVTGEKRRKSSAKRKAGVSAPALPLSKGSADPHGYEQRAQATLTALQEQQGAVLRKGHSQRTPRKGRESSGAPPHPAAGPKGLHSQRNHPGMQHSKQHAQNGHAEHQTVGGNARRAAACKRSEAGMHDSRKEHIDGSGAMPVPAAKVAVPTITAAPLLGLHPLLPPCKAVVQHGMRLQASYLPPEQLQCATMHFWHLRRLLSLTSTDSDRCVALHDCSMGCDGKYVPEQGQR